MKIALITANFGGIDKRREEIPQELPAGMTYQRFYYTDENSPYPFPNLPNRLKAKYFKLQSHQVEELTDFDFHVWIDANIELKQGALAHFMTRIQGCDLAVNRHHHRQTVKEEIDFILHEIPSSGYLSTRYDGQKLWSEFQYLKSLGMPEDAPLYSCNIIVRARDLALSDLFDWWWGICLTHSWFDQSAFSFIAHKYISSGGYINTLDTGDYYDNPYFIHHNHEKIQ